MSVYTRSGEARRVKIKRIDPTLPLPQYATAGAVGFDFFCREKTHVPAQGIVLIPANVILKVPAGYMLIVAARSSLAAKKGLMLGNGVGIIDRDYAGEGDEIKIQAYNFTRRSVIVEKGERIAQGILVKIGHAQWQEVKKMPQKPRGGFGTTG